MQHKHQDDARDLNEQAGPDGVGARGSQRLSNADPNDSEQPDPKEVNPLRLLKLIETIRQEFPVVAVQMELQIGFGLRLNESLQFEPFRCDAGNKILVYRGTKQGPRRTVDLDADPQVGAWQRGILDRGGEMARTHGMNIVAMPGMTLSQARKHYKDCTRKFGIPEAPLHAISRGLRHASAAARIKSVSGLPPVEQELPSAVYRQHPAALSQLQQRVTEHLGHSPRSITAAYVGAVPMPGGLQ